MRWGVVEAFFAVDPANAVSPVLPMMGDEDELVAETVIRALSDQPEPAIIDAYIRALDRHDGIFDQPASCSVEALAKLGADASQRVMGGSRSESASGKAAIP